MQSADHGLGNYATKPLDRSADRPDDQTIEQFEADRGDDEQIRGGYSIRMVA